jgi:hypothetical protein
MCLKVNWNQFDWHKQNLNNGFRGQGRGPIKSISAKGGGPDFRRDDNAPRGIGDAFEEFSDEASVSSKRTYFPY